MQWQPTKTDYRENMQHKKGVGHGPSLPAAPGGYGTLSVPDNSRVVGHTNAPPPEAEVKGPGPASLTKDWRTEASRVGRYWEHEKFRVKPNGTWGFDSEKPNPFNSRIAY